jgi:hypothetical protein
MKKHLATLVAASLVASIAAFSGSASAAIAHTGHKVTAAEKLAAVGLLESDQNGGFSEETTWKKQDFAVYLAEITGSEDAAEENPSSTKYKDVTDDYYYGYVNWATQKKYVRANSATKFGFNTDISYKGLEIALLKLLKYPVKGLSDADINDAAIELGLVDEDTDYKAKVVKGVAYGAILKTLALPRTGSEKTVATWLGIENFDGDVATAGDTLKSYDVVQADVNDQLSESKTWNKQDFAVFIARFLGQGDEAEDTVKKFAFTDVTDDYYDGYITWAVKNGYLTGNSSKKFGFNDVVTYQSLTTFLLNQLGFTTKGLSTTDLLDLAVEEGILPEGFDLAAPAIRGVAYGIILEALNDTVKDSTDLLGKKLKVAPFYYAPDSVEIQGEYELVYHVGDQVQFTAAVLPDNTTNKNVTWKSSNPNVATIDASGKVTAVARGGVQITATTDDGQLQDSYIFVVLPQN